MQVSSTKQLSIHGGTEHSRAMVRASKFERRNRALILLLQRQNGLTEFRGPPDAHVQLGRHINARRQSIQPLWPDVFWLGTA